MSYLLVLLVLLMTTFLSGLFSPASAQFSMRGSYGTNEIPLDPVPPGGVFEASISTFEPKINFCIPEEAQESCTPTSDANLPAGTQLISTNPDVASVEIDVFGRTFIGLNSPGSTTLQLRRNGIILASYVLVVAPGLPGTRCIGIDNRVADCSGKCVLEDDVRAGLGDGVCDNGTPRDDGKPTIDLSCAFIPEFFIPDPQVAVDLSGFTDSLKRDGGDCTPEQSCIAQFAAAPGFELCSASASVCRFNATTGGGTCAEMCQRFGSRCVAALDNKTPGCAPKPKSTDTCETWGGQTAICVCERR